MTTEQTPTQRLAGSYARTAHDAFQDQAKYFRSLPPDAWDDPTGCANWTMHDLAGHIVGEAVWFPNLIRSVTESAPPLPPELWEELKQLKGVQIAERMNEAASDLNVATANATPEDLDQLVNLGFGKVPLLHALYVCMVEAVMHNWDARAQREPGAGIPTAWAQILSRDSADFARAVARSDAAAETAGTYVIRVGDGTGPMTVTVSEGTITVEPGQDESADVTIALTSDQYIRLVTGRFPLSAAIQSGDITVEGDSARAQNLNKIFRGIGN